MQQKLLYLNSVAYESNFVFDFRWSAYEKQMQMHKQEIISTILVNNSSISYLLSVSVQLTGKISKTRLRVRTRLVLVLECKHLLLLLLLLQNQMWTIFWWARRCVFFFYFSKYNVRNASFRNNFFKISIEKKKTYRLAIRIIGLFVLYNWCFYSTTRIWPVQLGLRVFAMLLETRLNSVSKSVFTMTVQRLLNW